jgi:hypothetical protein
MAHVDFEFRISNFGFPPTHGGCGATGQLSEQGRRQRPVTASGAVPGDLASTAAGWEFIPSVFGMQQAPSHGAHFIEGFERSFGARSIDGSSLDQESKVAVHLFG